MLSRCGGGVGGEAGKDIPAKIVVFSNLFVRKQIFTGGLSVPPCFLLLAVFEGKSQ